MSDATTSTQNVSANSRWGVPLVMGILAVVIGLLLISHPAETSIWIAWLVGIYWFVGGVMYLVMMALDPTQWGWKLALGLLGIFAGVVVMDAMSDKPLLATIGLASIYVLILGIQGVIYGIVQVVHGFKGAGWGTGILGALSVVLGALLVTNAVEAALVLPWAFGLLAIVGGIAAIVLAFRLKNA